MALSRRSSFLLALVGRTLQTYTVFAAVLAVSIMRLNPSLIYMHTYTGCVTVSAFAGRVKLMRPEHCQEMFCELGQCWEPSADLFKKLQAFNANCAHNPRQQWTSTPHATSFSAHGVRSSSCIPCALTTRLASGDAVSNNIRKSQAQSSVAGQLTVEWLREYSSSRYSAAAVVVQVQP